MKTFLIFLGAVAVVVLALCVFLRLSDAREQGAPSSAFRQGAIGKMTTLSVNDTVTYQDGLAVKLLAVSDSRCPADTKCVWAGELGATFHVSGGNVNMEQDVALALESDGTGGRRASAMIDGYSISLSEVDATQKRAAFLVDFAQEKSVSTYKECVDAGGVVDTDTPPHCTWKEAVYSADMGNAESKSDLIRVTNISAGDTIESPLTITGEAGGTWYFEASFPIELLDADDNVLAKGIATAVGDWMTEDFVPFTAMLTFTPPASGTTGTLVLRKDNPSGDPARDEALLIPVQF